MCCVKLFLCVFIIVLCFYGYSVQASNCVPGSLETYSCRTCYCTKAQKLVCRSSNDPECMVSSQTENKRKTRDALPINDLKNTPCASTDSFELECNTCYCNGKGTGYLCTEKICPVIDQTSTVVETKSSSKHNTVRLTATRESTVSSTTVATTVSTTPSTTSAIVSSSTTSTTVATSVSTTPSTTSAIVSSSTPSTTVATSVSTTPSTTTSAIVSSSTPSTTVANVRSSSERQRMTL